MTSYTKTIRCTQYNAPQFRELVKGDVKLSSIVQQLKQQGVFPGLRSMSITLTGSREYIEQGLDAWKAPTPTQQQQACSVESQQQCNGNTHTHVATEPDSGSSLGWRQRGCAESPNSARVRAPHIGNTQAG